MRPPGITVIGQKDIYQAGLIATLIGESRFRVVRDLNIEDEILGAAITTNPSSMLIVIEPKNQQERTKRIVASLRDRFSTACIVIITDSNCDDEWVKDDNVDSCLPRSISSRALLLSLELVLCREVSVGISFVGVRKDVCETPSSVELQARTIGSALSTREQEILTWLARGQSNKAIARALDIEETTVKAHVRTILRKTKSSNRTQAAMMANNWIISPDVRNNHVAH